MLFIGLFGLRRPFEILIMSTRRQTTTASSFRWRKPNLEYQKIPTCKCSVSSCGIRGRAARKGKQVSTFLFREGFLEAASAGSLPRTASTTHAHTAVMIGSGKPRGLLPNNSLGLCTLSHDARGQQHDPKVTLGLAESASCRGCLGTQFRDDLEAVRGLPRTAQQHGD